MSLEARIPEMSEKELENLQANAERIAKGAASKQQAEAERLLPIIAEAMVASGTVEVPKVSTRTLRGLATPMA